MATKKKVTKMNEQGIKLEAGNSQMELLTVYVGDQLFGINIDKVQSIQQYDLELVTSLPQKQPGITGIFLYRNKTIPLLDLSTILGVKLQQEFEKEIIVVTEFNKTINSFKVQDVNRIYRLPWNKFVPLDELFEDNSFFTGSVNVDDTQVLVLDMEHILAEFFPDILIENISQEILSLKETVHRDQLNIVFAEDSPTMRKAMVKRLQEAGFKNILDFKNGKETLDYMKNKYKDNGRGNTKHVVLISDIDMPVMDGLTLCNQIKKDPDLKEIYVVMFSSLINDQMIAKCNNVKADNSVTKPEINQLIKILDDRC